jgi:cytochrome b
MVVHSYHSNTHRLRLQYTHDFFSCLIKEIKYLRHLCERLRWRWLSSFTCHNFLGFLFVLILYFSLLLQIVTSYHSKANNQKKNILFSKKNISNKPLIRMTEEPVPTELSGIQTQMNQTTNEVSGLFSTIFL